MIDVNVKNTYDQKRDEFLSVEQDLILFLKNAKKEEINTVIDTLKIAYDVDNNPKAYYFQQAQNGLYVREALICDVLGIDVE